MIADIYSHMLYQLSYAEAHSNWQQQKVVDTEGFEPSTSRMRNGRSSTELSAPRSGKWCVRRESNPGRLRGGEPFYH